MGTVHHGRCCSTKEEEEATAFPPPHDTQPVAAALAAAIGCVRVRAQQQGYVEMLGLSGFSNDEVNDRSGVEGSRLPLSCIVRTCVEGHTIHTRLQLQSIAEAHSSAV